MKHSNLQRNSDETRAVIIRHSVCSSYIYKVWYFRLSLVLLAFSPAAVVIY